MPGQSPSSIPAIHCRREFPLLAQFPAAAWNLPRRSATGQSPGKYRRPVHPPELGATRRSAPRAAVACLSTGRHRSRRGASHQSGVRRTGPYGRPVRGFRPGRRPGGSDRRETQGPARHVVTGRALRPCARSAGTSPTRRAGPRVRSSSATTGGRPGSSPDPAYAACRRRRCRRADGRPRDGRQASFSRHHMASLDARWYCLAPPDVARRHGPATCPPAPLGATEPAWRHPNAGRLLHVFAAQGLSCGDRATQGAIQACTCRHSGAMLALSG